MRRTTSEAFEQFWLDKGQDCVEIVEAMRAKEHWAMDWAMSDKLEAVYYAFERSDIKEIIEDISLHDAVELSSWLSSPISIALLSKFDQVCPGVVMQMLEMDDIGKTKLGSAFAVFVERIGAFSRARLLGEIFSVDRMRKMERIISEATKLPC